MPTIIQLMDPSKILKTISSATAEIARDADDVKQPFKVTEGNSLLCQSTR